MSPGLMVQKYRSYVYSHKDKHLDRPLVVTCRIVTTPSPHRPTKHIFMTVCASFSHVIILLNT